MEAISVLDIFKIGVGPSSSHTMGPWRAAQRFLDHLATLGLLERCVRVRTDLFGSLAKTGRGHATDMAVILGLSGEDPVACEVEGLMARVDAIKASGRLLLRGQIETEFDSDADLVFNFDKVLPYHANGIRFTALLDDGRRIAQTYYSVGGGFVVQEGEKPTGARAVSLPFPIEVAEDILSHCRARGLDVPDLVWANEQRWRSDDETRAGLWKIWRVMQECMHRGCHTDGILPGGLEVTRRARGIHDKLIADDATPETRRNIKAWIDAIKCSGRRFDQVLRWVSAFALAVNEENAAYGRVVTAPTNGAAGVIPAVMLYTWCFTPCDEDKIIQFMLAAGQVGILFKKGATISAAMGGCQAEIGVSSAMAAAGLTQVLGGSVGQVLMAAEIAMEHHLGMTCDPIGGLVQVPCIERNTMGAMKAILAASIAMDSDPSKARVSLDGVIRTMWATAQDMQAKYKETSEGGLAVNVSVGIIEC
jgi:L-serine dehydratase